MNTFQNDFKNIIERHIKELRFHYMNAFGDNYLSQNVRDEHTNNYNQRRYILKKILTAHPHFTADLIIHMALKDVKNEIQI